MSEYLKYIANSVEKTGDTDVKSQDLKDGSRKEGEGSQGNKENKQQMSKFST